MLARRARSFTWSVHSSTRCDGLLRSGRVALRQRDLGQRHARLGHDEPISPRQQFRDRRFAQAPSGDGLPGTSHRQTGEAPGALHCLFGSGFGFKDALGQRRRFRIAADAQRYVAMHEGIAVRLRQRPKDAGYDRRRFCAGQPPLAQNLPQRGPLYQFHNQERAPVGRRTVVVDSPDISVGQLRCGAGLVLKPATELAGLVVQVGKFDGYAAAEVFVFSRIDLAHSAEAELVDNAVVRDPGADQLRPFSCRGYFCPFSLHPSLRLVLYVNEIRAVPSTNPCGASPVGAMHGQGSGKASINHLSRKRPPPMLERRDKLMSGKPMLPTTESSLSDTLSDLSSTMPRRGPICRPASLAAVRETGHRSANCRSHRRAPARETYS